MMSQSQGLGCRKSGCLVKGFTAIGPFPGCREVPTEPTECACTFCRLEWEPAERSPQDRHRGESHICRCWSCPLPSLPLATATARGLFPSQAQVAFSFCLSHSSQLGCSGRCAAGCSPHPSPPTSPLQQWNNCIRAVSEDKIRFPNLTDISEVVTEQFLCSGTEQDDNPCKGRHPLPAPPSLCSHLLVTGMWVLLPYMTLSLVLCWQESLGEPFSLSGDSGFFR